VTGFAAERRDINVGEEEKALVVPPRLSVSRGVQTGGKISLREDGLREQKEQDSRQQRAN
jgi:hypothetical protein